jgi:hypothetical protein
MTTRLDGFRALPSDIGGMLARNEIDEDQRVHVVAARDLNGQIARGYWWTGIILGHCPSAWIDHAGCARNRDLYEQARATVRAEMGIVYRRQGRRFVRV